MHKKFELVSIISLANKWKAKGCIWIEVGSHPICLRSKIYMYAYIHVLPCAVLTSLFLSLICMACYYKSYQGRKWRQSFVLIKSQSVQTTPPAVSFRTVPGAAVPWSGYGTQSIHLYRVTKTDILHIQLIYLTETRWTVDTKCPSVKCSNLCS